MKEMFKAGFIFGLAAGLLQVVDSLIAKLREEERRVPDVGRSGRREPGMR